MPISTKMARVSSARYQQRPAGERGGGDRQDGTRQIAGGQPGETERAAADRGDRQRFRQAAEDGDPIGGCGVADKRASGFRGAVRRIAVPCHGIRARSMPGRPALLRPMADSKQQVARERVEVAHGGKRIMQGAALLARQPLDRHLVARRGARLHVGQLLIENEIEEQRLRLASASRSLAPPRPSALMAASREGVERSST